MVYTAYWDSLHDSRRCNYILWLPALRTGQALTALVHPPCASVPTHRPVLCWTPHINESALSDPLHGTLQYRDGDLTWVGTLFANHKTVPPYPEQALFSRRVEIHLSSHLRARLHICVHMPLCWSTCAASNPASVIYVLFWCSGSWSQAE